MIKILKHGNKNGEPLKAECLCGCEFEYETSDVLKDTTLMYTTFPAQIRTYIMCPECCSRIDLRTRYITDSGFNM